MAAWRHHESRDGFEVAFLRADGDGYRFEGHAAAVEDGRAWAVEYAIALDREWRTREALVRGRSASGSRQLRIEADRTGGWTIDGAPAPELDGCLDIDLEASSLTNAFPVHRLGLEAGQEAEAPAAWVRALDLSVERLEQRYVRRPDDGRRRRYRYAAPVLGFEAELVYDEAGLIVAYPGIAVRAA